MTSGKAIAWLVVLLALAGCGSAPAAPAASAVPTTTARGDSGPPVRYVAVGASETVGVGTDTPLREAWPQLFYLQALPQRTTFVNLGVPGTTVAKALSDQLPLAVSLRPTVVTVWLNVNDVIARVPPATFETQLDQLVGGLRDTGATVLVATAPVLDRLPAYLACLPGSGHPCQLPGGGPAPPAAALDAAVDAVNAATARVASRHGAILVDLHAAGEVPLDHPDWIAADGFHPSDAGAREVAKRFLAAYRAAGS